MHISGKTKVYGVIGDPVRHSLSPAMQNAAFENKGLNAVYLAFEVRALEVEAAISGMRSFGICGLNVTMPHKHSVVACLDEVDETSKFLSSVNTICNIDGKLKGFTTDGAGAVKALEENGVKLKCARLLILGGGGAAKAIAYALACKVEETVILNRTVEKAKELASMLTQALGCKVKGDLLTARKIENCAAHSDILINATSIGMAPNLHETLVAYKCLRPDLTVMDIVYNPVETRLAKEAKAAGAKVVSGLDMLVFQGALSFEIWTGCIAPVEVMKKAALEELFAEDALA